MQRAHSLVRSVLALSLVAIPGTAAFAGIGDFGGQVVPGYRGQPGASFAGFDVFSVAVNGSNTPDLGTGCSGATLVQTDPSAILTSTKNIYSFGSIVKFRLTSLNAAPVLDVSLQLRTLGAPLDPASVKLLPLDFSGAPLGEVLPSSQVTLGPGEVQFTWANPPATTDFRIDFQALAPSMSLDVALLDVRTALPALSTTVGAISLGQGGGVPFALDAGTDNAGDLYLMLGSLSGSSPGIPIDGIVLPLVQDAYTLFSLQSANLPPFANSLGFLDACGRSNAALTLPGGLSPALAGTVAQHAFFTLDSTGGTFAPVFASNAVPFQFVF